GIAGLIKVVLALQHEKIPRTLHFRTPNPHIPWASMPVKVAAEPLPWKSTNARTRIAGVSSFGFAGTNAHVVVEEPPPQEAGEPAQCADGPHLLAISARTERGLRDLAARYAAWLGAHDDVALPDVCYTANTGRNHFEHRAVVICDSCDTAQQKLDAIARGDSPAGAISAIASRQHRPRVAFLFAGQGLQYAGMARELYDRVPAFRECLDRCAEAYEVFGREDGSPSLKAVMFDPRSTELLKQTRYVQPALYALQVSLAALWRSWGVKPDALLGHSAGEYAAACAAGVFHVEDGLRLIVERARLMQSLPAGGTMLSVTAPAEKIETAISGEMCVHVSAYNGLNTVISGPIDRLDFLARQFEAQELYCARLPASNAFHSPAVGPILDAFEARAREIEYHAPTARFISTVTGKPVAQDDIPDAAYWRNQARQPVRFAQGVRTLFEDVGCDVVLELGPQAELVWLAQMSWRPEHKVVWASSLAKGRDAYEQVLTSAAQLHVNGVTLDFAGMEVRNQPSRKVALPSYPFQHECFWPGPMGGNAPSPLRDCFYRVQWHALETASRQSAAAEKQSWLILCDEAQFGDTLAAALRAHGQASVTSVALAYGEPSAAAMAEILERARREHPLNHVVLVADRGARDSEPDAMWHAQQ
ncbi:MAG TPA: type I polyketide synthase, partial [Burkholderiales bacterium]|nr:type I polyketide synthase [Burkholderiales bacterium]